MLLTRSLGTQAACVAPSLPRAYTAVAGSITSLSRRRTRGRGRRSVSDADRRVRGGESGAPGGVAWRPAQLALRLRVRGAAGLREHHDGGLARERPRQPRREAARRLRAERLGEHGQPFAHRRGVVVDDVVDRRSLVVEREHGCRCGVLKVDPGRDAGAVADDRQPALAHRRDEAVVGGAVEGAVAQRDPTEARDRLLEVDQRGRGLPEARRRRGVERIVLALDRAALPHVPHGGEALRDEPPHAGLACGRQQRVGARRSQHAGLRQHLVDAARGLRVPERGRLVDDRVRLVLAHDRAHGTRVEQVELDGRRAQGAELLRTRRRVMAAGHLVAGVDQLRDQATPDRTARTGDEHAHDPVLSSGFAPRDRSPRAAVTWIANSPAQSMPERWVPGRARPAPIFPAAVPGGTVGAEKGNA